MNTAAFGPDQRAEGACSSTSAAVSRVMEVRGIDIVGEVGLEGSGWLMARQLMVLQCAAETMQCCGQCGRSARGQREEGACSCGGGSECWQRRARRRRTAICCGERNRRGAGGAAEVAT